MAATAIPPTHRALLLKSSTYPYDMSVVEMKTPKAVPGSAVIRVLGSGVLTYGGRVYSGKKPYLYPEPFVPGSASIGRVAEVGADATTLKPGQLIFFDSFITGRDNTDSLILHGLSSGFNPGSNKLMEGEWHDGTYAEYAKVPLENCFPLDEERLMGDPAAGGLGYKLEDLMYLFALMIPCGGLMDVGVKTGERVIIAPATGTFGSAAILVALALGARVVAMSRNLDALERLKAAYPRARLEIAQNTGNVEADTEQLLKGGPADVFLDISPGKAITSTHYKSCISALKRGGRVSLMGAHLELSLPTQVIMLQDITVKGKWMYKLDDIRYLIRLVEHGYLKLDNINTVGAFPLEQFEAAFDAAAAIREPWTHVFIKP
ncbi:NAD(P)-binding protein [Xylariaceae sp. AK1471]|nr:NAD(P)-binding protein [Xylariaceae sp. AK1471]